MENNKIFRFWVTSSMRDFHVVLGVSAVACWLIGNLSQSPKMHTMSDIVTLFTIIHFFIHSYFHRQQKFVSDNQKMYSLPKKKIAKTGGMFLALFVVLVGIGIAVVKEIYSGTLLAKLKAMYMYLMSKFFGAVFETDGLGRDELYFKDHTDMLGAMNGIAAKADSPWENIVNSIQTVLVVIGVILLIVLCVALIVNYVRNMVSGMKVNGKKYVEKNVSDREESLWGKSSKREKLLDFSPTAKARRIYRRCINKQKGRRQAIPDYMTPAEIENMVSLPADVKYRELHNIYEKARYSEQGCTEDDVKRAKTLNV